MKKITLATALFLGAHLSGAHANEFEGPYLGLHLGNNRASATSLPDKDNGYLGLKAGYNWAWNSFLLGAEGYADTHSSSYTGQDAGLDARLGVPMNRWLPYARLGLVGTSPGVRPHGGLGVEYSLNPRWSVNAEWTTDSKDDAGITRKNNNIAIGFNYRLGAEPARAAPAAAQAPIVDNTMAERAAAERAAAEKAAERAAAERAAAEKAAADRAAAERAAASKAPAQPAYKTIFSDKPVTLEGSSFASGSAKLNKSAGEQLDKVVEFAAAKHEANLTVTGYTDDRGNAQSNLKLSAARAEAVKAYLVQHGVAPDRIIAKGEGAANPIADNKTAEGRAKNRRVEINSVIREEKKVLVQ
jgi:outer membrane protein OmpA-like peptidoglycan-associated protein